MRLRSADALIEEVMGTDIDRQIFLGIGDYLKSKGEVAQTEEIAFIGADLCRWASRHLGIPEDQSAEALKRLVQKRFIHERRDASSGTLLVIKRRILLRLV